MKNIKQCKAQSGNILFLILLAVILFAALSYAVTQSVKGGAKNASSESANAKVAELQNYFTQLDAAAQRMMLTGNVRDYDLNFYYQSSHNFVYGAFDNTNCTASRCRIFDPAGGAVTGRTFSEYMRSLNSDNFKPRMYYANVPGAGSDSTDLIFVLQGVKRDICYAVNKAFGYDGVITNVIGTQTVLYQAAVPVGPIPDMAAMTGIPIEAANAGTFCACPNTDIDACEAANAYRPAVWHVVLAR